MLTVNVAPFPTLNTERLTLRQLSRADAAALFILRSDPEVMRFIPRPLARSVEEVAQFVDTLNALMEQGELINWGIARQTDSQIIGTIGFFSIKPEDYRAEVGYMLRPDFQGSGLMQEALAAVLTYGFDVLKLHSAEAIIDPGNVASARLLERSGFVQEAHFKQNGFYNGRFIDSVHYSLLEPSAR